MIRFSSHIRFHPV